MEIENILQEHGDYLVKVAFLYVKNHATAEDIVQDVFIAFYEKQEQFQRRSSLRTYLVKMTVNRCYDYLKSWRYKRFILVEKIKNKVFVESPEQLLLHREASGELLQALFTLPIYYREILILYYFEEMTTVEIAAFLNCSESTVRTRLRRARTQLAELGEWELSDYE